MNLHEPGKGMDFDPLCEYGWIAMEEEVVETYRKHGHVHKQIHTHTHTH